MLQVSFEVENHVEILFIIEIIKEHGDLYFGANTVAFFVVGLKLIRIHLSQHIP